MAGRGRLFRELEEESTHLPGADSESRTAEQYFESRPGPAYSQFVDYSAPGDDSASRVTDFGGGYSSRGRGYMVKSFFQQDNPPAHSDVNDLTRRFSKFMASGDEPPEEPKSFLSTLSAFVTSGAEEEQSPGPEVANILTRSQCERRNQIDVQSNSLRISRDPRYNVFRYSIIVEPPLYSKSMVAKLLDTPSIRGKIGHSGIALGFDLFLPQQIEPFEVACLAHPADPNLQVNFRLKFIGLLPLKQQAFIFNILFKQVMQDLNYVYMKNKFFDSTNISHIEEYRMEIWPGFVLDVLEVDSETFLLQCDVSHRLLQKTCMLDHLRMFRDGPNFQDVARKQFVGQSVLTTYNNRTYRIDDIDFRSTPLSTFQKGNYSISYVDYFLQQWGIHIKDFQQPLLIHRRFQKSTQTYVVIHLIPELCNLTGMRSIKDRNVFRQIINKIQIGPNCRYTRMLRFVESLNENPNIRARFDSWGIKIEANFLNTKATLLDEEEIITSAQRVAGIGRKPMANWSNLCKESILKPVDITSWFIVFTRQDEPLVKNFVSCFGRLSRAMTSNFDRPRPVMINSQNTEDYLRAIKANFQTTDQLVVIVTPGPVENKSRYDAIKQLCCIQLALPSQFIRAVTLKREKFLSICPNIVVQITCKLGGYPWAVSLTLSGAMYIGIDIYHKKQIRKESVVAFVATLNSTATRWYSKCLIKADFTDLADPGHLFQSMTDSLHRYRLVNNCLPKCVMIYRDDVGTSKQNLCNVEFNPLMSAIQRVYNPDPSGTTMPHITFLTVAKRIGTKLFSVTRDRYSNDIRVDNAQSGTILELGSKIDQFYLVSQKITKSTAVPVRLNVMKNTSDLVSIEMIQAISYKLCYLYYNTAMVARQPAPGMYAHKLAYFIGEHLESEPSPELEDKLFYL